MMAETSDDSVLGEFLAGPRGFGAWEDLVRSVRMSIARDAGLPGTAVPPGQIPYLVVRGLRHAGVDSASELSAARSVLPALVSRLGAQGHLDPGAVASAMSGVRDSLDELIAVKRCAEALRTCARQVSPAVLAALPGSDWVEDKYLTIDEVTGESVTFADDWLADEDPFAGQYPAAGQDPPEPRLVGPVAVPAEVARLTEPGWSILLSAARIDGQWRLLEVMNGIP
jgi:hypothetical protein